MAKPGDIRIAGRIAGVQGTEQSVGKKMLKSSIALRECESTEQSEGKKMLKSPHCACTNS